MGHDLDVSRSRDAIGHVTNRSAICHFLLVSHCNWTSISNRFRDIWPPNPVRTHRQTDRQKHTQTHAATDFIFCPMQCIALDRQKCSQPSVPITPTPSLLETSQKSSDDLLVQRDQWDWVLAFSAEPRLRDKNLLAKESKIRTFYRCEDEVFCVDSRLR